MRESRRGLRCEFRHRQHPRASRSPATVSLAYYRTQEEYDQFGRGDGPFHIGNANARRVADALEAKGIDCEFYYPGESEAVETCSPHAWG